LDSAEDLVASIADTFIAESRKTPKAVSNTAWYKQMQERMAPRLQAASAINSTAALQCPSNCLDVHVLSGGCAGMCAQTLCMCCHPLLYVCG
jgi:hypothetical protein